MHRYGIYIYIYIYMYMHVYVHIFHVCLSGHGQMIPNHLVTYLQFIYINYIN